MQLICEPDCKGLVRITIRGKHGMNVNKKVIIAGARSFCIIMMLLQLVMLFFFLDQKVLPMSAVSGVSFFAFLLCVVLLEKENFYGFTVLLPTILLFYAGAAILLIGRTNGFQHLFAASVLLAFYAEYVCKSLKVASISGKTIGWLALAEYLLLLGIGTFYPAPYSLTGKGADLFDVVLEIIVLVGSILCLSSFHRLNSFSERILQDQASPDELVAITFTEKATQEMISRIDQEISARLTAEIKEHGETSETAQKIRNLSDSIDQMQISTIHSFCHTLLMTMPFHSELGPEFEVTEDDQTLATRFIEQKIRDNPEMFDGLEARTGLSRELFLSNFKAICESRAELQYEPITEEQYGLALSEMEEIRLIRSGTFCRNVRIGRLRVRQKRQSLRSYRTCCLRSMRLSV